MKQEANGFKGISYPNLYFYIEISSVETQHLLHLTA